MSKALGSKLSAADSPQDLLAGLWGLAQLGAKADAGLLSKAAGTIKAAVGELSTEQQIYAAWSFALLGQVGRGAVPWAAHLPAACLSVLGNTQFAVVAGAAAVSKG
jgi:hypothetical protein